MEKDISNFIGCTFLQQGDNIKLSSKIADWKVLNSTTPQYVVDGLLKEKEYKVEITTPVLKVVGADQQFVMIEGCSSSYPCWCFEKIKC